jgi:hypothetical protein
VTVIKRRSALLVCTATFVLCTASASLADTGQPSETNRYVIRAMTETFDGVRLRSVAQDIGFGRVRQGDESYVVLDLGDGNAVHRAGEDLSIADFTSPAETDAAFVYNYRTHELKGPDATAWFNNTLIRPLLDKAPALGADARWELQVAPAEIGMAGLKGEKAAIRMERKYFTSGGVSLVLVTYDVPGFSYITAAGETVVHLGRGAVLADPSFGTIYWAASRQQAVARTGDGNARPYRFAKNFVAAGLDGKPLVELAEIAEVAPLLQQMVSTGVEIGNATAAEPDQTPLTLAALIDMTAVAVGENSPNQALETAATFTVGKVDRTAGAVAGANVAVGNGKAGSGQAPTPSVLQSMIDTVNPYSPNFVPMTPSAPFESAGQVLGEKGKAAGANLDVIISLYGTPDKLIATIGAAASYSTAVAEREAGTTIDAIKRLTAYTTAVEQRATQLSSEIAAIRREYNALADKADSIRSAIQDGAKLFLRFPDESPDRAAELKKFYQGVYNQLAAPQRATIKETEAAAASVLQRMRAVEAELSRTLASAKRIEEAFPKLRVAAEFLTKNKLYEATRDFVVIAEKSGAQHLFAFAGGVGNIGSMAAAAGTLGNYDPSASGDRTFTNNYSNTTLMVTTLGLNILGFAANAATKNPATTFADVAAWGSGYLTDLYIATQDVVHASETSQQATMEYALTVMRRGNQLDAKRLKDLADYTAQVARIDKGLAELRVIFEQMAKSKTIEPGNPHFDQKTGLPKAQYWGYLKTNAPWKLREYGIDPDAPVGGWPGGTKPDNRPDPTPPPTVIVKPRLPEGPNYPTAKKKPASAVNGAIAATNAADEPPAPSEWVPPPTVIDPPVKPTAKPKPVPASYTPPPSTTEWLKTTPLKVTPLNPTPLNFTPVKPFEPPVYKNPVFKPPEWVPPTFKAPTAAEIKWDKSADYPGGDDNLAFSFGDMKGKVSTDLSPWRDWLAKQNVARLKDLAIAGGYPTLAAALTDAANLKRQSSDLGFRNYAFGPPAFSGSVSIQFGRDQLNLAAAQVLLGDALNAGKFGDPVKGLRETAVGDRGGLDRLLAQPFNVVLTWGAGAFDLDLHMTGPRGESAADRFHIYYAAPGNLTAQPFAQLIKDCICSSGSEVILTSALNTGGLYRVSVFNFGDQSATSTNLSGASNAVVQIVRGGTTQSVGNGTTIVGGRVIVSAAVPTSGAGNTWVAAQLDPRNGRITVPGTITQSPGSGGVE